MTGSSLAGKFAPLLESFFMKAVFTFTATAALGLALLLAAGCASQTATSGKQLLIDGQTLASLLPASQRHQIKNSIPERYRGDVLIAQAMGHLLDAHQKKAVEATNAYLAKVGRHRPHLNGWLVVRENGVEKVLFITKHNTTPYVAAIASKVHKGGARIKVLHTPRKLDSEESALWQARELAFQAKMKPCSKQYHPVVLPVTAAGVNEIYVYLLPLASTDKIVLGGYYRVRINARGTRILDTHAYTHACLEVERRPQAIGAGVTELESPTPTAPQVYANLRYKLPIYVSTNQNRLRWKIEQGRISLLKKPSP